MRLTRLVSIRESKDSVVDIGSLGRFVNLLVSRIDTSVSNVVPKVGSVVNSRFSSNDEKVSLLDGIIEQDRVLRDDSNGLADRGLFNAPDVLAIQQDGSLLNVEKAEQQADYCGFPLAGWPNL